MVVGQEEAVVIVTANETVVGVQDRKEERSTRLSSSFLPHPSVGQ